MRSFLPILLIALVLASPAATAASRSFSDRSLACELLHVVQIDGLEHCKGVSHSGAIITGSCSGMTCTVSIDVLARGEGAPAVPKEIRSVGFVGGGGDVLCSASSSLASVSCAGSATFAFVLADTSCTPVRVETTYHEPPLSSSIGYSALVCRSGGSLTIS